MQRYVVVMLDQFSQCFATSGDDSSMVLISIVDERKHATGLLGRLSV